MNVFIALLLYIVGLLITFTALISIILLSNKKEGIKGMFDIDKLFMFVLSVIWPFTIPFGIPIFIIIIICEYIYRQLSRWLTPTILLLLFLPSPILAETIDVEYIDENRQSYNGCGVIYSPTICITAGHITNFKSNEPVIIKKDRKAINGIVKYVDAGADVAIIVLEKEIEAPTLIVSDGLVDQEIVQVDCFTRSRKLVYSGTGTNDSDGTEVCTFNGKVEPGMSGSPIYDNRKRLVSIVSGYAKKYNETVGCHPRSIKKALDNVLREH